MCKILNKERRRKGLQTCRRASSLRMVANSSTSIDRMVWKVEKKDDVEDDDAEERLRVDRRAIPLMSWRSIETLKRRKRSRAVIHWLVSQRGRWRRRIKLYLGIVYSILCTVFERGLRNTSISKDPNPSKITLFLLTLWGKEKKEKRRKTRPSNAISSMMCISQYNIIPHSYYAQELLRSIWSTVDVANLALKPQKTTILCLRRFLDF